MRQKVYKRVGVIGLIKLIDKANRFGNSTHLDSWLLLRQDFFVTHKKKLKKPYFYFSYYCFLIVFNLKSGIFLKQSFFCILDNQSDGCSKKKKDNQSDCFSSFIATAICLINSRTSNISAVVAKPLQKQDSN